MKRMVFPTPFQSLALRRSIDVRRLRKLGLPADLAGLSSVFGTTRRQLGHRDILISDCPDVARALVASKRCMLVTGHPHLVTICQHAPRSYGA